MKRPIEQRFFDATIWLICACILAALLTSCSAAITAEAGENETPVSIFTPSPTAAGGENSPPEPTPGPSCRVSTGYPGGRLHMRSGPGVQHAVILILSEGDALQIVECGPWLAVIAPDGTRGYVNGRYCK